MTDREAATTILFIEHVLWQPDAGWDAAVDHLAARFARATPLDVASLRAAGALHEQLPLLEFVGCDAGVDLDRELGRWFDEHVSMLVRPNPVATRAVRARAATGIVHAASALPPRAAESIARHAGCWRSITQLHAGICDADAAATLTRALGSAAEMIAAEPTPLPAGIARATLLTPVA